MAEQVMDILKVLGNGTVSPMVGNLYV